MFKTAQTNGIHTATVNNGLTIGRSARASMTPANTQAIPEATYRSQSINARSLVIPNPSATNDTKSPSSRPSPQFDRPSSQFECSSGASIVSDQAVCAKIQADMA